MSIPAFYSGTGRRKTAIARVRLLPGEGEIVINGRTLGKVAGNAVNESEVRMPFRVTGTAGVPRKVRRARQVTGTEGRFNVTLTVEGGGVTGQSMTITAGTQTPIL